MTAENKEGIDIFSHIHTLDDLKALWARTHAAFYERAFRKGRELQAIARQRKASGRRLLTARERQLIEKIFFGIGADDSNRFEAFWEHCFLFTGPQYWYALRLSFASSDNLYVHRKHVRSAFTSDEPGREYLMNGKERRVLGTLPDEVRIYRAMSVNEARGGHYGVSWTLSNEVAEFFRDDYPRNFSTNHLGRVIREAVIHKSAIVAYIDDRKEKEVIYVKA